MIVKRKLYSVMDEEGNQGYYLYDEATGEEKLFSIVEEEQREFARGTKEAGKKAMEFLAKKGNKIANKQKKFWNTRHLGLGELSNLEESESRRRLLKVGEKLNQAKIKGDLKGANEIMSRFDHGLVVPVIDGRVKAKYKNGLNYLDNATYVKNQYTPEQYIEWRKRGNKNFIKDMKNKFK